MEQSTLDFSNEVNIKRTVCGIGYMGKGPYRSKINGNDNKAYKTWKDMLRRCYNQNCECHPLYQDCSVCEEWQNFQNFALWYEKQIQFYDTIGCTDKLEIDKDFIEKGNRIYGPGYCILVPDWINSLITGSQKIRGNCPIGVTKVRNKFLAQCRKYGRKINLGCYYTKEDAFYRYKTYKENLIKEMAEENKLRIPNVLYIAMKKYHVDITD